MANYYQTTNFGFQTPQPSEDLDIPGDLQLLATQVDDALAAAINNNIVTGVSVTTDGPTNSGSVVNGTLVLNIIPEVDVSTKYDKTGGTITGNATITGTLTVNGATSVPVPTLSTHAATKGYVDGAIAGGRIIGEITMFGSASAPAGWLLCDGGVIPSQYTALRAIYGTNTPDLRNKFVIGAGSTYAVKSSVGSNAVQITTANMPSHNHGGTVATDTSHDHTTGNPAALGWHDHTPGSAQYSYGSHAHSAWTDAQGSHNHNTYGSNYIRHGDEPSGSTYHFLTQTVSEALVGYDGLHGHNVGVNAASEGHSHNLSITSNNMSHSHATVVNAKSQSHLHNINFEGGGQALNIIPLSYALTYIVFAGS